MFSSFPIETGKRGTYLSGKTGIYLKRDRHGQAAIISDVDYSKIRKCFREKKYRLLFDIARYTGERWGALIQLRIDDVFDDLGRPRSHITFRARTRKAGPDGRRRTRSVPIHPALHEILEGYRPDKDSDWLFPSPLRDDLPITMRAADAMLRSTIELAGLGHKGISTHSTRRTFITRLWERGVDLHSIQVITGHQDLKTLVRYVEADPTRISKALALL